MNEVVDWVEIFNPLVLSISTCTEIHVQTPTLYNLHTYVAHTCDLTLDHPVNVAKCNKNVFPTIGTLNSHIATSPSSWDLSSFSIVGNILYAVLND